MSCSIVSLEIPFLLPITAPVPPAKIPPTTAPPTLEPPPATFVEYDTEPFSSK